MTAERRTVTSLANPEIKKIRSLAMRKYREKENLFIAEGLRHALEAAEAGWTPQILVIEDSVKDKDLVRRLVNLSKSAMVLDVPESVMESITKRDNHQTVVAVLEPRWINLDDVTHDPGLWVALEEIRDPGNLGTIMRSADAAGAKGIILIGNTCDPFSLEAIRASMGSFPHVKISRCSRTDFMQWAEQAGWAVVGTHLKTQHDYRELPYTKPLVLLMGNEQAGLTEELAQACTALVKIPMQGKADSLNVSVATAIMLFEINRGELAFNAD